MLEALAGRKLLVLALADRLEKGKRVVVDRARVLADDGKVSRSLLEDVKHAADSCLGARINGGLDCAAIFEGQLPKSLGVVGIYLEANERLDYQDTNDERLVVPIEDRNTTVTFLLHEIDSICVYNSVNRERKHSLNWSNEGSNGGLL